MSRNPKIVQLPKPIKMSEQRRVNLPPILHSVRQSAKKELTLLLAKLFNHTDDALFEMADRSSTDQGQGLYFESMRQIRIGRAQISADFISAVSDSFESLLHAKIEKSDESGEQDLDEFLEGISLVENEELEITVALNGMCSKITSMYSLQIMQLTRRMDTLYPNKNITEQLNPLGPYNLGCAFVSACDCLDIDFKVLIFLLKLFEQHVMEYLEKCYKNSNQLLIEAGILPELKGSTRRRKASNPPERRLSESGLRSGQSAENIPRRSNSHASGITSAPDYSQGFSMLQALLAGTGLGAANDSHTGTATSTASTDQLLNALDHMQANQRGKNINLSELVVPENLLQVLKQTSALGTGSRKSLVAADDDTINLVGMLFDCILNDRNLAIPMKALISRLQIPCVKIAVVDKSFFTKTSHPARQLLNELSSAGIGWSSAKQLRRDAVYSKIESVVLGVLDDFNDDISVIENLVSDLKAFVKNDRNRTDILEHRVKDAETGKAITSEAKLSVQNLINQKASGLRLPPEIGKFISELWSKALVYTWINDGEQSEQWQLMVNTLDELLWSVQPLEEISDMERRDRLFEHLSSNLCEGIRCVTANESELKKQVSSAIAIVRDIAANDRAFSQGHEVDESPALEPMLDIILSSEQNVEEFAEQDKPQTNFIDQISRLKEGSWVEMLDEGERLKVTAIIEPGGKYIFVNQRGMKVTEKSRMSLAVALESKRLLILDESQVFDRALQSVIGNLRHMHRNKDQNPG